MSGLAAVFARNDRPAPAAAVLAMLDAIPYRGPDGAMARSYGRAVLGHARMAVSARERSETQPLTSPRTGCAIVADMRLDNRDDVRARLASPPPSSVSDARLVLCAYEELGLDAPSALRGDFAFAIWDPRSRRLLCARDVAGQRTLFYRSDMRTFAAASEIHQLLQDPATPLAADEERIRSALLPINLGRNDKEQAGTYFSGIRSLLPGHLLVATAERIDIGRFARLEPRAPIRYRQPAAYVEHFRELFFQAVADRLQTDERLSAMLSGGLDSSSIVCAVQQLYRSGTAPDNGFLTLSAVFDGREYDERSLIADVQDRYGFDARYLTPDRSREWLHLEPDGFRQRPELPTSGMATLFDAAEQAGTRVVLTGELADSYLRGSPIVFDSLLRQGKLRELPAYLQAYRAATRDSLAKTLALFGVAPLLPLSLQKRAMSAFIRRKEHLERWRAVPDWIPGALRERLLDANEHQALADEAGRVFANETQHTQHQLLDPPETPTIAWGWPIEIWRPFADRRLQEFALAVPPEQLFAPIDDDPWCYGGSKQLLRRAMRGMLPDSIRTRTNPTQFSGTVNNEIDRQWSLHEAAFGPNGRSEVAERGYIDPVRFWQRLQHYRGGQHGADFRYLNYVIGLETWFRGLRAPRAQATTVSSHVRTTPAILVDDNAGAVGDYPTALTPGRPGSRIQLVAERR